MVWQPLLEVLYVLLLTAVCGRIIYDTNNTAKTLAYLLLVVFVPVGGMVFYFFFGINYRKRTLYNKKIVDDYDLWQRVKKEMYERSVVAYQQATDADRPDKRLVRYLVKEMSPLTAGNAVTLLTNGEEKFPAVLNALEAAREHIHIEYYIYENDNIGRAIKEVLIRKAGEGVKIRFIYDDFGSRSIRHSIAKQLRAAGVETFPFFRITFMALASRLNYRNHRKIIIVDGEKGFVGGINVSDRYINNGGQRGSYWRDTHLMIEGPGVAYLQYLFIGDWNFCSGQKIQNVRQYFPDYKLVERPGDKVVQIAASGPDSAHPTILYSLLFALHQAEDEILITTPYLIPDQSIMDAIVVAALGGVTVKVLVPAITDSKLVGWAARSYYESLLSAGVKLYAYQKGFIHAKTMVVDRKLAIVGTANMDYRSFDLNFEVNALVYDTSLATSLATVFENDLNDATEIDPTEWVRRSISSRLPEKIARLVSPLL
ncbi:cardiolipin synthase [Chryseolinea sp. T2]|uniref:cardiolipin synthase n=1 Tax=Chryseolinea sp. T2 TaxID=3129255 RepID=UPI00307738E0